MPSHVTRLTLLTLSIHLCAAGGAPADAPRLLRAEPGIGQVVIADAGIVYERTAERGTREPGRVAHDDHDEYTVTRVAGDGTAATSFRALAGLSSNHDGEFSVEDSFAFAASAQRLALVHHAVGESGCCANDASVFWSGPLSGPLERFAECADTGSAGVIAVDATRVAYAAGCTGGVRVREAAGGPDVVIAAKESPNAIRLRGDHLAFAAGDLIPVADRRTGATRFTSAPAGDFDVQSDGTLVTCRKGTVAWASPAEPADHVVGTGGCANVRISGGRILYVAGPARAIRMVDLAGTGTELLPPLAGLRGLDFDGARAVFTADSCTGTGIFELPLTSASTPPALSTACSIKLPGGRLKPRKFKVRVRVSCPQGCVGELTLVRPRADAAAPTASAPVVLAAGVTATRTVTLAREFWPAVRRHRRLRLDLVANLRVPGQPKAVPTRRRVSVY